MLVDPLASVNFLTTRPGRSGLLFVLALTGIRGDLRYKSGRLKRQWFDPTLRASWMSKQDQTGFDELNILTMDADQLPWCPNPKSKTQNLTLGLARAHHSLKLAGSVEQASTKNSGPKTRRLKPETHNTRPESRIPKSKSQIPNPKYRNSKSENWNLKPGT